MLEDLDGWIRRKLRCLLWRQWKRAATHKKKQARGRSQRVHGSRHATHAVLGGRGGASHTNAAYPKSFFDGLALVSLLDTQRRVQRVE